MGKYNSSKVLFLILFFMINTSCGINFFNPFVESTFDDQATPAPSTPTPTPEPPVPGNSGLITITDHTLTSINFGWAIATDSNTPAVNLVYRVVRSDLPNIDTADNAEANGTQITDWTANLNNALADSLTPGSLYFLNIIVKNEAGGTAAYTMKSGATILPSDASTLDAFYPFNGNALDESGNENNLSLVHNPVLTTNREDQADKAYEFHSATIDYLYVPDSSALVFTSEMTISVWVYLYDNMSDKKILGKAYPSTDPIRGYVMGTSNGRIKYEIFDTEATRYLISTGDVSQDTWHHLALTWKTGGKMRAYVDGVLTKEIDASTYNIGSTSTNFRIGCAPWSNYGPVDGKIDDIRLYAEELTAGDIAALYSYPVD
jgi:hypothetical protein